MGDQFTDKLNQAQERALKKMYREELNKSLAEIVRDKAWKDAKKWMKANNAEFEAMLVEEFEAALKKEMPGIIRWAVDRTSLGIDEFAKKPIRRKIVRKKK